MKRFLISIGLLFSLFDLRAADSTIANLAPITTVPDSFRMPWENPGVLDYYITFQNLTNQILFQMANQAYVVAQAQTAGLAATNGFPWLVLSDAVGAGTTAAHDSTNLLGQVYLKLIGGTVTGPVLSSSATTTAPAANEFPVAGWVRGLLANGTTEYLSTSQPTIPTNTWDGNPIHVYLPTPQTLFVLDYTISAAGQYVGGSVLTNQTSFGGPVVLSCYVAGPGNPGNSTLTMHPEIYFSTNVAPWNTNLWYGDYHCQPQTIDISSATTNQYQFVVPVASTVFTNAGGGTVLRIWKVDSVTHGPVTVRIVGGTNATVGSIGTTISYDSTIPVSVISSYAQTNDARVFTLTNASSGYVAAPLLTNQVYWTNVVALTNSQFQKVDMTIKEGDFMTNAAFSFLGIINKSTTNYQSAVVTVFNTTGSVVPILAPGNVHTNGALAYNVTNMSKVLFYYSPIYNYTSMYVFPEW